ncbi:MAG: heat-inducible transcription repressor HrcA [Firmicutes bacterium]|nr:heat-inducible transcription repressor HrcA [Bacillota bacterium]MBQ1887509.1 heat-inducible transcription repressor HrcA [Bacillota bacterium]MBQ3578373.1 heat-inducible transcription repressor HrcA [Bacillota bacterium]MBQ4180758.1 heat-inducible transcription repressor HrcA [Bacillota bacterium]MBQ6012813.1 heat-inducible transcription repressor HrcA [Bacillota bacterium]
MELNERKLQILQAIVADFIYSAEPVGSRTISKKYDMGLSPATIRNEMSDLEEMGYLTHPHTSAGRVPSDKAYRLYVDQLMRASELTDERKQAISSKLSDTAAELDRTIEKAASLLSEITNLVSFAITPSGRESKLKYVNLLPVDERTIVLMIVSEDGQISNTPVKLSCGYTEDNLRLMSRVMTHNFMGKTVSDVLTMDIIETIKSDLSALDKLTGAVVPSFMQTLEKMLDVDLYMDGYTNIFSMPEYSDVEKARNFLTILQQKDHITNVLVNRDNGLIITIGDENSELKDCSLITADYRVNGRLVGKLGVIGPTRMRYSEISSVIRYMTDNISKTFEITGDNDE